MDTIKVLLFIPSAFWVYLIFSDRHDNCSLLKYNAHSENYMNHEYLVALWNSRQLSPRSRKRKTSRLEASFAVWVPTVQSWVLSATRSWAGSISEFHDESLARSLRNITTVMWSLPKALGVEMCKSCSFRLSPESWDENESAVLQLAELNWKRDLWSLKSI